MRRYRWNMGRDGDIRREDGLGARVAGSYRHTGLPLQAGMASCLRYTRLWLWSGCSWWLTTGETNLKQRAMNLKPPLRKGVGVSGRFIIDAGGKETAWPLLAGGQLLALCTAW